MDRSNIEKIAQTPEDRLLLRKLWDKINSAIHKNIPVATGFLSPRELTLARYLFGSLDALKVFGGYDSAERNMLVYLPDYLDEAYLLSPDSPVICLHVEFYKGEHPNHRDFLGALIGCGISRDSIGDILVRETCCDFFVTAQIAPWILENLDSAGRTALKISVLPLTQVVIPEQAFEEITDTVASVRLDSIVATSFHISRSIACDYIAAGKAAIDGLSCEKPDQSLVEGAKISVRGLGKLQLQTIGNTSKKGRIFVTIRRYQ